MSRLYRFICGFNILTSLLIWGLRLFFDIMGCGVCVLDRSIVVWDFLKVGNSKGGWQKLQNKKCWSLFLILEKPKKFEFYEKLGSQPSESWKFVKKQNFRDFSVLIVLSVLTVTNIKKKTPILFILN